MRRSVLLAPVLALLAAAPASATVVPQQGMKGVKLGMSVAQVRAVLGPPNQVIFVNNDIIGRQRIYAYGATRIGFDGDAAKARVITTSTSSRRERLANGIGVGSRRSAVAARVPRVTCKVEYGIDHCWVGKWTPGQRVTDFLIGKRGTVSSITVSLVID